MPPAHPTEKRFEDHIEQHLLASGYRQGKPADYDKTLCLIPNEITAFIQATQPETWQKLEQQYENDSAQAARRLCERIQSEIDRKGTLQVLRKGIETRGCKFKLAYFRPSSGMNPDHLAKYQQNRFVIVRQLQYSQKNTNELDLTLFLNGLPLLTAELKNSLTGQFVEEAIKQYKTTRDPKEPLFKFKRCLVHFAVGNEKAFMTTRLAGDKTFFLPFNKDVENPVNPNGFRTHYLWEDIWQPDTLLALLQSYLCVQVETEKIWTGTELREIEKEKLIFPRYHQLDAVRCLLTAVTAEGAGHTYLIQHSAGSGKSNSIAWLAHQLANLYRSEADTDRLFDSIIVVTDRRVLDRQLQNTIKQFEQTAGTVVPIDKDSAQLRQAIEKGKDIIVTTLQKFPVISSSTAAQSGKRFAVLIDEAHSSQSGESAKHLNETLTANLDSAEAADTTEADEEDKINERILADIQSRSRNQSHISYFAFTATPKPKTLRIFGRKNPQDPKQYLPYHEYTMRQAIDEKFILDVLQNYTTYERYFKLRQTKEVPQEYTKNKAARVLKEAVDLDHRAIEAKCRIILDHFLKHVADRLEGRARAMICTRSRLHAVRFFLTLRRLMTEVGLPYKPLVAFTGTVKDTDVDESFTESGLNGLQGKIDIPDAFKLPNYRILVVANKYQTGFDEPLLSAMYVDKKLGKVNAVQTLSRLNRASTGKEDCLVLDFVNEAKTIQDAFQPYYQTTLLSEESDPDRLYTLKDDILNFEIFNSEDVEEFAKIFWATQQNLEKIQPLLDQVRNEWCDRNEEEREAFRSLLQNFNRLYGFYSQIITFEDLFLEKFYAYVRLLNRKLDPRETGSLPKDLLNAVQLDSLKIQETYTGNITLIKQVGELPGTYAGESSGGIPKEAETDTLANIVQRLNEQYGANLTEEDRLDLERIQQQVEEDPDLAVVMEANNTDQAKWEKFSQTVDKQLRDFVRTKLDLYKKVKQEDIDEILKRIWFEAYQNRNSA
jgi:type I restriction enzyme R subunit